MARPDIAIMVFDLSVSGVARNAVMIANAAHEAGLHTEIWLGQAAGPLRSEVHPNILQRAIGAELAAGYSRADRKAASNALSNSLAAMLEKYRPAVAFSSGNHFHDLAAAARRKLGPNPSTFLIARVSNAAPNAMRSANPLRNWLKRRKAASRYATMDHLVAVSREIRDELVQKLHVDPAKISLISNGVDTVGARQQTLEAAAQWPWRDDTPIILGVGRLVKQKNFELLIDAFALARMDRPLHLAILGSGPDGELERLTERAAALGVADDVWLPGHVANPFPYYRDADLFVLSSRWEGMSNSLLEAMACGCRVAAVTSAVGSAEILDDGRYGPLVPPESEPLASAMLATLARGCSSAELIERAEQFDLARTRKLYVNLIKAHAHGEVSPPAPADIR
jgi:glycosyltransferase involved in cell wall biosynthesis